MVLAVFIVDGDSRGGGILSLLNLTQKHVTELLDGEIFESTMRNFTQMPQEITPANQFDPQE